MRPEQGHGNAKDVQTHLRHSDNATTLGVYPQPIDADVRSLVHAVTTDDDEQTGAGAVRTPAEKS
jgi:hypothetical protein